MAKTPAYPQRPYFDDFDAADRYLRILFRPGFAVQARELTQIQTMLQNQLGDFADSIYENGSVVIPGDVKINSEYAYSTIQPVLVDLSQFIGGTVTQAGSTISAKLMEYIPQDGADAPTIYLNYSSSETDGLSDTISLFPNGTVTVTHPDFGTTTLEVTGSGYGIAANLNAGIYYYNGLFVPVVQQSIILNKYDNTLTDVTVGLDFVEEFVTDKEDSQLLDNAQGSTNFTAPGAHRLRINAILKEQSTVQDKKNFIEVLQIRDGGLQKLATNPEYSLLEQTLARRTFDESGDYIVRNFSLDIRENLDDGSNRGVQLLQDGGDESKLSYDLSQGKAYVRGFEIDKIGKSRITVDKPRTTQRKEANYSWADIGSYVIATSCDLGVPGVGLNQGQSVEVVFKDGVPDVIGTQKLRQIQLDGINYRLYIYDINFNTGKGINDQVTVTSVVGSAEYTLEVSPSIYEATKSTSIFQVSETAQDEIDRFNFIVQKRFVLNQSGEFTVPAPYAQTSSSDNFLIFNGSAWVHPDPNDLTVAQNGSSGTITGASGWVIQNVRLSSSQEIDKNAFTKSKTKTEETLVITQGSITSTMSLGKVDIINIKSITAVNTADSGSPIDVTSLYILDNGQRDNQYRIGSVSLKSGQSLPAGIDELTIVFDYYQHSSAGVFFNANSYNKLDGSYQSNPRYTDSNGTIFDLLKSFDFRQQIADDNTLIQTQNSIVPKTEFDYDHEYFLARVDKIVLGTDGEFTVVSGTPQLQPEAPADSDNSITVFELDIPAYSFSTRDIGIERVEHRRYTMRDIGILDKRIKNLEYYTSLNLLELDTESLNVGDKFKSGFLVDNFTGHAAADVDDPEYSIQVDVEEGYARPEASIKQVDLEISEVNSTNIQVTGDIVTLPYIEKVVVDQPLASSVMKVNPFAIFSWIGSLELTPSSDFWISVTRQPDIISNTGGVFETLEYKEQKKKKFGTIWNSWELLWSGKRRAGVFGSGRRISKISRVGIKPVAIERTQLDIVNDKVVSTQVIPYIRERTIQYKVSRMKPNSRLYVFFDGQDITEYATPENIVTDSTGFAEGLITIPNRSKKRFRVGEKLVYLTTSKTDPEEGESFARATYTAEGISQTRQQSYIQTRVKDVVLETREQKRLRAGRPRFQNGQIVGWIDPLAQSFLVDLPGGAMITSVDLYFDMSAQDLTDPVTVQIRTMVNGYPGPEILPFAEITVDPGYVNPSQDGSVATNFQFKAPVLVQENTEYCVVVLSNSDELQLFVARQGERNIQTNQQISKQPYAGVLFKSQNNSTWTADQTADMKIKINRASFTSMTGTANFESWIYQNDEFGEADPIREEIGLGDAVVDSSWNDSDSVGSTRIKFNVENHDLRVGDVVELETAQGVLKPTDLQGLLSTDVYDTQLTVVEVFDLDSFAVSVVGSIPAGQSGPIMKTTETHGPVFVSTKAEYSTIRVGIEELIPNNTSQDWYFGGRTRQGIDLPMETPILSNVSTELVNINDSLVYDKTSKVRYNVVLKSERENLSPILDTDRISTFLVSNRINNFDDDSGVAQSKYITKPITLTNPANGINVILDVNKPFGTAITAYYRVGSADQNLKNEQWVELPYNGIEPGQSDNISDFREYNYQVTSQQDFQKFQVKIVLSTTEQNLRHRAPQIADFRAIATYE